MGREVRILARLAGALLACALLVREATAGEAWGYLLEVGSHRLHVLAENPVRIGRLRESEVLLLDPRVSRRHAKIEKTKDGVALTDLRSTNGSRLNSRKLRPMRPVSLAAGDIIELASQRLLFAESRSELWTLALQHALLGRFVRLRVPVYKARQVSALGRLETVEIASDAVVDMQAARVTMSFTVDVRPFEAFESTQAVLVAGARVLDGQLRLSLWGPAGGRSSPSPPATGSALAHGELKVAVAAASDADSRARFMDAWAEEGMRFLGPLLSIVLERLPEADQHSTTLRLARDLMEQPGTAATRDAAQTLTFLQHLYPRDSALPLLIARAQARWAQRTAEAPSDSARTEDPRLEPCAALVVGKSWIQKAEALGADALKTSQARAEIAEAAQSLGNCP